MTGTRNAAGSGSYVLHAMDPGERRDFEDELIESEELRSEVTELTDTAVLLGLAVPAIQPAPSLKAGIMARIATLPQLAAEPDEPEPLAAVLPFAPRLVTPDEHWYNRPVALVVSAAAAVVLIVGGVVGTGLAVNTVTSNQQAAALTAISAAPDARQAEASVSTGGTATLVWSDQLGRSAFVGSGLKSLPSNETYELWYIDKAGKAMAAGLFDVTGDRTVSVLVGTLHKGDTVGVTVEPAGGSTQPTTKPILAIQSS